MRRNGEAISQYKFTNDIIQGFCIRIFYKSLIQTELIFSSFSENATFNKSTIFASDYFRKK